VAIFANHPNPQSLCQEEGLISLNFPEEPFAMLKKNPRASRNRAKAEN
jgi:hypothetical protein